MQYFAKMSKDKGLKLQSNQKLNTKLNSISQPNTPNQMMKRTDSFTLEENEDLQEFTLNPVFSNQAKDEQSSYLESEKSRLKNSQSIKLEQIQKKVKERQQQRKTKGLAIKMKIKLSEQIKAAQRQLQQKQSQLKQTQAEIQTLRITTKQTTKHNEDIANNEQMLKFKQGQLNNLVTIHSEILEGAKKQLAKEKLLKIENQQKLQNARKKQNLNRSKWNQKQNSLLEIQQLAEEKNRLEKLLEEQKKADQEKLQLKADARRDIIEELIQKNKKAVEQDCQWKARIVRQCSHGVKNLDEFKFSLEKNGIYPSSFYTFSQLKKIKQLNFKTNKQAQKIFQILQKEVKPKIIDIIEHIEEPKQILVLKTEMSKLQETINGLQIEVKAKQLEIKELQVHKNSLAQTSAELKKKSEAK